MVGRGHVTARRRREKIYVLADKTVVSCEEVNTGSGEEKVSSFTTVEGIFALYTELLITGEAQIEAGWSVFRDTVLGGTFSKDTLFQFCYFMVDASL